MKKKIKIFFYEIFHPKDWMIVYYIRSILWKIEDYDRISHDYACVLDQATCSAMSKTNYLLPDIYTQIDQAQSKLHYGIVKSDITDIIQDRDMTNQGKLEEIKKYLDNLYE